MGDRRQMTLVLFLALCQGALGGCYKRYGCNSWWSAWYFWCILVGILVFCCILVGTCCKRQDEQVHSRPVVVTGGRMIPDHVYNNSGYITSPNDPGAYVYGGPPSYSQVQMGHVSPPDYHEVVKHPTQPVSSAAGFPENDVYPPPAAGVTPSYSMAPTARVVTEPSETLPPYLTHPTPELPNPPPYTTNTNTS